MNEEQIRQMRAGREMDCLVAEQVMGWVWMRRREPRHEGDTLQSVLYRPDWKWIDWCELIPDDGKPRSMNQSIPAYSTDIAAAWGVVERLYNEHWIVSIGSLAENPRGWRCELCNMWPDDFERAPTDIEANGDTAPLAICRAALLAAMERGE